MKMTNGTDPHYKVKWYFCPAGATPLPGDYHLFGSDIWHQEGLAGLGLGEGWNAVRTYSKGQLPGAVTGQAAACGDPEWFKTGVPNGTPSLANNGAGLPSCCFPAAPCQPFKSHTGIHRALSSTGGTFAWFVSASTSFGVTFHTPPPLQVANFTSFAGHFCLGTLATQGSMKLQGRPNTGLTLIAYDAATSTGTWIPTNPAGAPPGFQLFMTNGP